MTRTPALMASGALLGLAVVQHFYGGQLNALLLPGVDKILHVFGFAIVFSCIWWLLQPWVPHQTRRASIAAAIGVALSMIDEASQRQAADRSFELFDLVADWSGLTLAWVAVTRPAWRQACAASAIAAAAAVYVTYDTYDRFIDYARALRYEARHDFGAAREHYLRALAKGLNTPEVHNGFAWVSIESGQADARALAHAAKAYDLQPGNPDVLDTYGWALHHAGRNQEAVKLLERAFAMKPEMFCIHYHLGRVYSALGRAERAQHHFEQQMRFEGTREAALASSALEALGGRP